MGQLGRGQAALEWLERDRLLHICMSESIRRGHADVLYAGADGVLLRDDTAEIIQASFVSAQAMQPWLETICSSGLDVVAHQDFARGMLTPMLPERPRRMNCYHSVYTKKQPLPQLAPEGAHIAPLTLDYAGQAESIYKNAPPGYVTGRIRAGVMLGVFYGDELAGFIGEHTEGAQGMLEVLPQYRRRGLASALMAASINAALKRGQTPFGQIVTDNKPSLALSRSLGLEISRGVVTWFFA